MYTYGDVEADKGMYFYIGKVVDAVGENDGLLWDSLLGDSAV